MFLTMQQRLSMRKKKNGWSMSKHGEEIMFWILLLWEKLRHVHVKSQFFFTDHMLCMISSQCQEWNQSFSLSVSPMDTVRFTSCESHAINSLIEWCAIPTFVCIWKWLISTQIWMSISGSSWIELDN